MRDSEASRLTRLDADGMPSLVQFIEFDKPTWAFCCYYFDGSEFKLLGRPRVTVLGMLADPNDKDWWLVESEAILHYTTMQGIKTDLVHHLKRFKKFTENAHQS